MSRNLVRMDKIHTPSKFHVEGCCIVCLHTHPPSGESLCTLWWARVGAPSLQSLVQFHMLDTMQCSTTMALDSRASMCNTHV